ncbi:MAG: hypothetical protein R2764_04180 [Bacteroidales bacterium]
MEKENIYGNVSHDPENHQIMCELRAEKVNRVADYIKPQSVRGEESGDLLIVSLGRNLWCNDRGLERNAGTRKKVSLAHFHHIHPLPRNTEEIFSRFKKIIVPELNLGQFVLHLRMNFRQFKFEQYNKIQGLPFMVKELVDKFNQILEED